MNYNRILQMILAMISSFAIIVSFTVPVFAATRPNYSLDEWQALTREEIYNLMVETCADNGGTYKGTVNDINGMGGYALYRCYRSLNGFDTTAGSINGVPISTGDPASAKFMLSQRGLADFGDGNYKDNGHSSNSFSEEMNDRFDEYQQEYPYSGINNSVCYKFPNGYYISWEPLQGGQYGYGFGVGTATHLKYTYSLRFYLHNESGKIIEISTDSYDGPISCPTCNTTPYHNFTILPDGKFSYDAERTGWVHIGDLATYTHTFPWYSTYGDGEEDKPTVTPVPITLYNIDNGDTINAYREGDSINYNNTYYDYGDTVTIGGNTYSVYYDYRDMSEDYLNEFYNYVYNYYYDNIGTDYKFDDSAILEALRAIYDKLQAIFNKCQAGFRNVTDKLNEIIKQLKSIGKSVDDIANEDDKTSFITELTKLIEKLKSKLGITNLTKNIDNITSAFFTAPTYTETQDGQLLATYTLADDASTDAPTTVDAYPHLYFTYNGQKYDFWEWLPAFSASPSLQTFKDIVELFLIASFCMAVFRSIPDIVLNAGKVAGAPSAMSEVEAYRRKYD
ncbi:MAG: hypothetical protein ACLU2K_04255 [Clostridia bacterium]|jgi:hypothetical protein|uniref:hypothetical protein n=1 Tax=Huintestinicola butyrica TaxID=2981728 RepID=UPI00082129E1|nr:hypothetical protein [Huintestinicola butyrica]MBS6592088.1 hypothetical protein [Ruminococcus sp.]MCU6728914.1 hypothetical protein [Huintestinicola butyrica]SCJ29035.1 Uncharacterised protein [uncultured Ruminococcus sp.]